MLSFNDLGVIPSAGAQAMNRPRTLTARFGEGYMGESGDGPNAHLRDWQLPFNNVSTAVAKVLDDFFRAHKGYMRFTFTQPAPYAVEGPKIYVCKEWTLQRIGGDVAVVSAIFLQRPPV